MAGFDSIDNFISEISSAGKFQRADFMIGTAGLGTTVNGRWYDMTYFQGTPPNWIHGNYIQNYDFTAGTNGWTLGSANWAWTPATHVLTRTANADLSTVTQNTLCESGVSYKVTYTLTRTAGGLTVSLGGTNGTQRTASGTYIEIISCGANANAPLIFTPDATFAGTIDLIIVQRHLAWIPYGSNLVPGNEHLLFTGGDVSPDTKHIINMGIWGNAAATAPATIVLVDMLGCYPFIATDSASVQTLTQGTNFVANGTFTGNANSWTVGSGWTYNSNAVDHNTNGTANLSQTPTITPRAGLTYEITYTISNFTVGGDLTVGFGGGTSIRTITGNGTYTEIITATGAGDLYFTPPNSGRFTIDTISCYFGIPRYSDGVGVRAFYSLQNLNGANASNFVMTYTNTIGTNGAGTGSRGLGCTVAQTASAIVGHIAHSGAAANQFGPYLPLQGPDVGIRSIQSCQFTAAQATANGCVNIVLVKPLASIPVTTSFVSAERDLMNQLPSLPRIKDGAVLGFLVFVGNTLAAGNLYGGYIDCAWS